MNQERFLFFNNLLTDYISQFSCCGIVGSEDWKFNGLFTCESNMSQFLCGVPHSCCKDKDIIKEVRHF